MESWKHFDLCFLFLIFDLFCQLRSVNKPEPSLLKFRNSLDQYLQGLLAVMAYPHRETILLSCFSQGLQLAQNIFGIAFIIQKNIPSGIRKLHF